MQAETIGVIFTLVDLLKEARQEVRAKAAGDREEKCRELREELTKTQMCLEETQQQYLAAETENRELREKIKTQHGTPSTPA